VGAQTHGVTDRELQSLGQATLERDLDRGRAGPLEQEGHQVQRNHRR
jgi:hypothetical protein